MIDYFVYYSLANIFCLIVFGILLAHDLVNKDCQEKQVKYDQTLIVFMGYFIVDSLGSAVQSGIFPCSRILALVVNFAAYALLATITYAWLKFVMAVEQVPHRSRPINKFAVSLPLLVFSLVLLAICFFNPQAMIRKTNEIHPVSCVSLIIVTCINIGVVLLYTIKKVIKEHDVMEKRKHLFIGFFPLVVVISGLTQILLFPTLPIFCFSSVLLMLIFYIESMETQISTDPLTKLNNRNQLLHYIKQMDCSLKEYGFTCVVMIDVNDFKAINDTYGHAEGDEALIIIAKSLRKVASEHAIPLFLGRYGGDEFILIAHPASEKEIEELICAIREQVEAQCILRHKPYLLTVSIGYDKLRSNQDTIQKCIQRADKALYRNKPSINCTLESKQECVRGNRDKP